MEPPSKTIYSKVAVFLYDFPEFWVVLLDFYTPWMGMGAEQNQVWEAVVAVFEKMGQFYLYSCL